MAKVYLQLGSNLGDKNANLERALQLLEAHVGKCEKTSQIAITKAVGFDAPDFANCTARCNTRLRAQTILKICKNIEREMGRPDDLEYAPDGSRIYHNRIIDIDILLYCPAATPTKSLCINTSELTIPHPQIETRPFVKPLLQEIL